MKDPLFINKLAGAIIAALLLIFGLPQLTAAITGGGSHGGGHGDELHLAYGGDIELATEGPKEVKPVISLAQLLADASPASGERRSALCKSCHTFEEGGANGTGPNLWNIVGREVANVAGFNFTSALTEAGGVWSLDRLDAYLKNSQEYIPGTAMVQRVSRDTQRAELLVYLRSLSNNPVALPLPEAIEAVVEEVTDAAIHGANEVIETATEVVEDVVESTDNH